MIKLEKKSLENTRRKVRLAAMNFRRANFELFKGLLGGIPQGRALEGRGPKRAG